MCACVCAWDLRMENVRFLVIEPCLSLMSFLAYNSNWSEALRA